MSFFKKLFSNKETTQTETDCYGAFWIWFEQHQQKFHDIVRENNREKFSEFLFNPLRKELDQVHQGIFYLAGMLDQDTAEIVFTPDGVVPNIVFIEELVAAAPEIAGWKFTALKPEMDINQLYLEMHGYDFNKENLSFYLNDDEAYPDEIDLVMVHDEYQAEMHNPFTEAVYIYLDNYLGEYNAIMHIDHVTVCSKQDAEKELMPIDKLKNILTLKNSEISRLNSIQYDHIDSDEYSILEGQTDDDQPLSVMLNSSILEWEHKASHPWMFVMDFTYQGQDYQGMPSEQDYDALEQIDQELYEQLIDKDGYLFLGRETGGNKRTFYYACKDFRKPSKLAAEISSKYKDQFEIETNILKDKYWHTMGKFGL
ncbi:DUF695 domain-containing protein [Acinetobacter gerneri]|uniref:DUF695 domain-containing protein n=1 Tax=Acinetobacter gerneri DSM 14967 = CIP 107464 = MTCC 9824 TaxID=1120926 RepID=N8ZUL7_9GAMM|nr:DUF695 domain-containing protein [Acinetobacter gerneri]ENV35165.1 hypothetical protein F960_00463 [Acinetobacter gerneri DSM 14967 = CIP 107464 = MTCC 9824]EPR83408.1 hypothetical protein L289_2147 [Acinetobacter gerneri DSM 14967 = CIP 107464 = MTCC 9824]